MKQLSQIAFCAILACFLLGSASSGWCRHDVGRGKRIDGERPRVAVRVRRLRGDYPTHHPVRPAASAIIPPDDDDDENRFRLAPSDASVDMLARPEGTFAARFCSRSSWRLAAAERPLHQTLHILLI